jgi:anti-sigma factor RsiW
MMCRDVELSLNAWVDGELDASGAAAMDEHLRACDPCRRRFETLKAARAIFRTLAPAETTVAGAARPQRYYAPVIALAMCVTMLLLMARAAVRPRAGL